MIELSYKQTFHTQGVPMNNQILPLFSDLDDFCRSFEPSFKARLLQSGDLQRHRKSRLALSEIMTIIIWFQQSSYRTFKDYYQKEVCIHLRLNQTARALASTHVGRISPYHSEKIPVD